MINLRSKKIAVTSKAKPVLLALFAIGFGAIGVKLLTQSKAATIVIDASLPKPQNVKTYGDDRVSTITWDAPTNAAASNIVGYYVSWGKKSDGVYTGTKQTTFTTTQIQPIDNNVDYNVSVQAVQGSYVNVSTPGAHDGNTAQEARGNGKVSSPVTVTTKGSSARVDQLRTQMTGFFDDFNTSAGAFDELKWNSAGSTCVPPGSAGAFINGQFHAHSEARSSYGDFTYCDRGQFVNRPRATFDTTGKTEANPGVISFDFDGVTRGRDFWYIDLVPLSARKSGAPLDITSHNSAFDDDTSDPVMLRLRQGQGSIGFSAYDNNKNPIEVHRTYTNCPDFAGNLSFDGSWCGGSLGAATPGLSPLPEPPITSSLPGAVPNVRRHWRMEVSATKIKVFVDSIKMIEADMPSNLQNVRQWTVQNNIFTYNTGKDDPGNPTTSMLHWDNFGFNGPAPGTVVHNYIDGGSDGNTPYFGKGSLAKQVPGGDRSLKINIPDTIGNPVKARLMFTFGALGFQSYTWQNGDNFVVNGKTYAYANPLTNSIQAPSTGDSIADTSRVFADSISINAADLKQGMNDIKLNFAHGDTGRVIINVHLELEYTKGAEPAYTPPKTIFGDVTLNGFITPAMTSHDNYLFVEQNLGLTGTIDPMPPTPTPTPTPTPIVDTTAPVVAVTQPTAGLSVTSTYRLSATATDASSGISKVAFYLDGSSTPLGTVVSPPYTLDWPSGSVNDGTHSIVAKATDTAGNVGSSPSISFTVSNPVPDTTKPTTSITAPANNTNVLGTYIVRANAADNAGGSGVTRVELYIDGALAATDLNSPYTFNWITTQWPDKSYTLRTVAYDGAGNSQQSTNIIAIVKNAIPTPTPTPTPSPTPPTALKKGDTNNDQRVDGTDISAVLFNWSKSGRTRVQGDLTGEGVVNAVDASEVLFNWGK